MANKKNHTVDWDAFLSEESRGKSIEYGADRCIYWEGDTADSIFFLRNGKIKLSVTSKEGKEAIISVLEKGDFFGEGCLAGQSLRMASATALTDCSLFLLKKSLMIRLLQEEQEMADLFITHLLARNIRYEADLVDQLFNSAEKRLARILILLSNFGKESKSELILPRVSQENLAEMIGTTRSRVSHFMNKFRKHGFIDYSEQGGLTVNSSLLSVVLHD